MPIFRFADMRFDSEKLHLTRAGKPVAAQPRVLELLTFLIEHRGRVVTREEMADALWERAIVSEDAITKRIGLLRRALGDTSRERRFVQTSYGQGARFIADVTEEGDATPQPAQAAKQGVAPQQAAPPSIIVLPFRQVGDAGPDQEVANGLPDDITSALVKLRSTKIIARGTALRYAGSDTPLPQIGRELGVTYALGGSVEVTARGIRVYAELLRTGDEAIIWSENYRVARDEIHDLRDTLIAQIVNQAEIAIPEEEASRAALKMPSQLDAWESYHRALSLGVETLQPDYPRAQIYFDRALSAVPDFSRAHAALAFVHWNLFNEGHEPAENRDAMMVKAERAVALDRNDPMARVALGTMLGSVGDLGAGAVEVERAVDLAPGMARAHAALAGFRTARGQWEESLAALEQAEMLSPRDPHLSRWISIRLVNHVLLGHIDAVHDDAREIERIGSDQVSALGWALAGFSLAGDAGGATRAQSRLQKLLPGGRTDGIPASYESLPPMLKAMLAKTLRDYDLIA